LQNSTAHSDPEVESSHVAKKSSLSGKIKSLAVASLSR